MRTPKAPAGFVAVDSEEARKIKNDVMVNYAYIINNVWMYGNSWMRTVRGMDTVYNCHVQLPPPVEWEEVWGWERCNIGFLLTYEGMATDRLCSKRVTVQIMDSIVRALNEMEGRDG